jgi:benzoylformate decarboxylase
MPASLGIKLEEKTSQGIGTQLVVNAVGDGSSLFYPQTWWTAAHQKLPILYIVTNNHEYHTLQLGLQQVVAAYGSAPGYGWHPKTMDPDYLRLERPRLDFVSLAKAFGGESGEVVETPGAVRDAIERGIEHVLNSNTSYILDMRIAQNTPTTPVVAADGSSTLIDERYTAQPALDIFHAVGGGAAEQRKAARGVAAPQYAAANIPSIF